MRFLHTSDWHLGRTLHGVDLIAAQRVVLQQICELVAAPPDGVAVDAVLISGDIYDRAVPPVEAIALFSDALAELTAHTAVIVTGGNHDSAIRLGFGSALFNERLHVRTSLETVGMPVLISDVAVYPLPYLDPDAARVALSDSVDPLPRTHQAVMAAAMNRVRVDLAQQRAATRSIVMAHAFVVGGTASESERSIVVGGVDSVTADTFDGVDYVALGHLHGPQEPRSKSATVLRYSGSPLRYSFSERAQVKSVTVVDVGPEVTVTAVPLAQPRGMAELSGTLDELMQSQAHRDDWVRVTVTDRSRPDSMFDRVKSHYPHVLQVFHLPEGLQGVDAVAGAPARDQDPRELGSDFIRYVTGVDADDNELDLFDAAYHAAAAESVAS
jgi:exonuclease SbcD